jgi:hypothetical protein
MLPTKFGYAHTIYVWGSKYGGMDVTEASASQAAAG